MRNPMIVKEEKIAQYKRQYRPFDTASLKRMALNKGFTEQELEGRNKTDLAWKLARAKYSTERGYDIHGNNKKEVTKWKLKEKS